MADSEKSSEGWLKPLVIAVAVAIIGGGTAPWWLDAFHQGPDKATSEGTGEAPHQAVMGAPEVGFNRHGGDTSSQEVVDANACSLLCQQSKPCLAMTFVAHPNVSGGVCWLKTMVPDATPAPGMTSAVKVF